MASLDLTNPLLNKSLNPLERLLNQYDSHTKLHHTITLSVTFSLEIKYFFFLDS